MFILKNNWQLVFSYNYYKYKNRQYAHYRKYSCVPFGNFYVGDFTCIFKFVVTNTVAVRKKK